MKKLLITWALLGVLGSAGVIQAADLTAQPYVRITTTPNSLDLGTIPFWDEGISNAVLTVNVESNSVHGPIVAVISELKRPGSASIPPERVSVKTGSTNGFVSMAGPVAISETTMGSHQINLNFKVRTYVQDLAGRYEGSLTLTVMPPS